MSQIHQALSHYWHLRDQGKSEAEARQHVRMRFGVEIGAEPLASQAQVVDPPKQSYDCETIVGSFSDGRRGP